MSLRPLSPLELPLDAPALVEASAGTGKTFTITTLFLRLLLERGIDVSRILVVTFTNAATAELRARVRRRIREALGTLRGSSSPADETLGSLAEARRTGATAEEDVRRLEAALQGFDEASISTIHGFCQRVLADNAFESGSPFDARLVANVDLVRDEIVRDFVARRLSAAPRVAVECIDGGADVKPLSELSRDAIRRPRVRIVPPHPGEIDLTGAEDARDAAWEAMRRAWDRDGILRLVSEPGLLKRNQYRDPGPRIVDPVAALLEFPPRLRRSRAEDYGLRKLTAGELLRGVLKARRADVPRHPFFDACERFLETEQALSPQLELWRLGFRLDLIDFARSEMRRRNEDANRFSFDDLLHRLDEALDGPGTATLARAIREAFDVVLIDEFQDTDPVQWRIFRRLFVESERPVFLIGDPKQAIYSFRGADVFTYRDARLAIGASGTPSNDGPRGPEDADRGGGFTLRRNWRSDPGLIRAVNAIFGRAEAPFLFDWIGFAGAEPREGAVDSLVAPDGAPVPPFEILLVEGEKLPRGNVEAEIPARVAAEIAAFLGSGVRIRTGTGEREAGPGDAAVLCRTNRQAAAVHRELQKIGLPSVLYGDASVFDSLDAEEVEWALGAMAEPGDPGLLRAALATTLLGRTGEEIARLQQDEAAWDATVRDFVELSSLWERRGFVAAFRELLEREEIPARLLRRTDGERRLTNVFHLGELLQAAASESRRGPLSLVEWLHRMRSDLAARAEVASEAAQIRLESDERRIKLTTIHQAKGLEYGFVWAPFLWTPVFEPTRGRIFSHDEEGRLWLDVDEKPAPEREDRARLEEMAESLRVVYVALTRAKHRCSVVWGHFDAGDRSALGHALHPPEGVTAADAFEARVAATGRRMKSPESLRADLGSLVEESAGTIVLRDLAAGPPGRWRAGEEPPPLEEPREATRSLRGPWRTSSFSRLTSGTAPLSLPASEGRDHEDAGIEEEEPAGREPVRLLDFPRGARAGECLHAVLEHAPFGGTLDEIRELAGRTLTLHGIAGQWADEVARAIVDTLETPLGGDAGSFRLRDLAPGSDRRELEFLFSAPDERAPVTPTDLAGVFGDGPYGRALARLGFPPFAGFLRGFVDLVFGQDGRWYVVDWKSNFLGGEVSEYRPARLREVMESHHYVLQLHLYALALHRHLRSRLPGYDYDRHFGGGYYLFLRGMSPAHPEGTGIFHERPSRRRIEELDRLFSGRSGS